MGEFAKLDKRAYIQNSDFSPNGLLFLVVAFFSQTPNTSNNERRRRSNMRGIHIKNFIVNQGEVSYPNADCDGVCGCHQIHRQFENLGLAGGKPATGRLVLFRSRYLVFCSNLDEMQGKGLVLAQFADEQWSSLLSLVKPNVKVALTCTKSGRFNVVLEEEE